MAVFEPEFKQASKDFGQASYKMGKSGGSAALRGAKKHKWVPALGIGYSAGLHATNVVNKGRATDKHPYSGYYN